ncbi:MAG: HD domain-containing protein [Deltaproteobacteria bacterium]|nr:HD domain-containing protein [Deltaproteobacteria bacterium]
MATPSAEAIFGHSGPAAKGAAVSVLLTAVTLFLFSVPEQSDVWHQSRDLIQKLFFFPLLLSAAWFGGPGAAVSTVVITGVCGSALLFGRPGNLATMAGWMGELGVFWMVGALAASFFEQQKKYVRNMEEANENTLIALASALDVREHGTGLHSQRVAEFTLRLAQEMDISDISELAVIWKGAMLHDIGKIGIPDRVLLKPGPLTEGEWQIMRRHPEVGHRMLERIEFLCGPAEIVLCHHERFDGTGYPRGLSGEEIPLGARLFAVIDVYDALTTVRSYHDSATHAAALSEIRAGAGSHFDPAVVAAFERVPAEGWAAIAARNHRGG